MTAGWRRGSFPSTRRSSGRTAAVAIAVVVLAIVIGEVAADVVNSGRTVGRVEARTFVTEVMPLIDESTALSSTMHLVRNGGSSLERITLEHALGQLVEGTSSELTQLGSLGVPAPNATSGELLHATIAARARGSRDFAGAIALAIGPSSDTQSLSRASSRLAQAGRELIAGDKDYRDFLRALPRSSGRGRLPSSKWVADPASWSDGPASSWVAQLSGSSRLQVHGRLVIVAMTVEPPVVRINGLPTTTTVPPTTTSTTTSTVTTTTVPAGTGSTTTTSTSTTTTSTSTTTTTMQLPPSGSTSVLPPTHQLSVVLVVANAGNTPISDIWAAASVVPQTSGGRGSTAATRSTNLRIGRLEPGSSLVVTLPRLRVSSGRSYMLFASIGTGSLPTGPVTAPPGGLGQIDQVSIRVASG